jgi:hypothetical protein
MRRFGRIRSTFFYLPPTTALGRPTNAGKLELLTAEQRPGQLAVKAHAGCNIKGVEKCRIKDEKMIRQVLRQQNKKTTAGKLLS